ncbi:hypothetical protein [Microbulbifer sp. VAAF005]|uniref:hypothetical protein n=1 Tax=Microbulbifer sp. VAAF005 TaxID=3034230 RepID=UPI0024AD88F0|nr:hypothetical protein [Microbulbifer sp. VAAF005]WHI45397.1 hypothetical protein P0078_16910 [Microbulbifer sp. VAAF005]
MATSFISEHSAEFVLVPRMKALLEKRFSTVVPIFPWLSREFGNRAKNTHGFLGFHVLALFPRRPKVSDDNEVLVTINGELSVYKAIGAEHGITVLAGCPKATNLWELASCDECAWIDIDGYYDYLENIDCLDSKLLTDDEVIESVSRGEVHTMDSLENFIRETRYVLPAGFFGMRYKPVYFLAKKH